MKLVTAATALAILLPIAGQAQPCQDREIIVGYLSSKGMALHSWGLTSDRKMHELFLADGGNFVVAETLPTGCMKLISALDKEGGRLWRPPVQNKKVQPPNVSNGETL